MSQVRDSAMSLVTLVVFLVLMAIALVLYGGNEEQKAKMENNVLWQKARIAVDYGLALGSKLIGTSSEQNNDSGILINDIDNQVTSIMPTGDNGADSEPGFWSGLGDKIKSEWQKDVPATESSLTDVDQNVSSAVNIDWQKTENGGEIILKTKNGTEYKLPIPFKLFNPS